MCVDVVGWYLIDYDVDCDDYEKYGYCANDGNLVDSNGVANPVN